MLQALRTDFRTETKFLISTSQKIYFEQWLRALFKTDAHGVEGRYPVLSRYFDTPNLEFFYQKIEGEYFHVKLRARRYSQSLLEGSPLFLESKIKQNIAQTKIRIVDHENKGYLLDPTRWHESMDRDREYFLEWRSRHRLTPTVHVFYHREAFELEDPEQGKIRINFDTDLTPLFPFEMRVTEDLAHARALLEPGEVLMEIKHAGGDLPPMIAAECQALGVSQTTYSKYANCLLALDQMMGTERVVV